MGGGVNFIKPLKTSLNSTSGIDGMVFCSSTDGSTINVPSDITVDNFKFICDAIDGSTDSDYSLSIRVLGNSLSFNINGPSAVSPIALFYEFEYNGMVIPLLFAYGNVPNSSLVDFFREYGFSVSEYAYSTTKKLYIFV